MHNFKPGDLAVLIGSIDKDLIGKTVEIVAFLGSHSNLFWEGRYMASNINHNRLWVVRLCEGVWTDRLGVESSVGACREQWLMPLRGDFAPERHKSQELPA